jgi:hypothetical protein
LQDHLQRDRLHARMHRERLPGRPALDLCSGELADHLGMRAHRIAME